MTSERHAVAAKVIATVDDLDRIAADDNADVPALHGWRRELFGEKALALKHGKLALAVEQNRVVAVERGGAERASELWLLRSRSRTRRLLRHEDRIAPDQARELAQPHEQPLARERRIAALEPQFELAAARP